MARFKGNKYAFTLIELLVVIVVIGVLAAIIIPIFTDQAQRSKQSASESNLNLLSKAIAAYRVDTGLMPLTLDDLTAASAPANGADPTTGSSTPLNSTSWHGPYINGTIPVDPLTGDPYNYSITAGSVGEVTMSSLNGASQGGSGSVSGGQLDPLGP